MAVRPIDGNELVDTLNQIVSDYTSHGMYPSTFPVEYVIGIVEKMPTLTPPNEWVEALEAINNAAVAYMEGGPYENDLPGMEFAVEIDRLSRDFVRPPNEPLTWNELAEMEGQPVYIVEMGARRYWALVIYVGKDTAYLMTVHDPDDHGDKELYGESWVAYRRPQEEQ